MLKTDTNVGALEDELHGDQTLRVERIFPLGAVAWYCERAKTWVHILIPCSWLSDLWHILGRFWASPFPLVNRDSDL